MPVPSFTEAPPGDNELSAGLAGLAGTPALTSSPADQSKPTVSVRWLTDKKRVERYDLLSPLEVDGVEYHVIMLKRLTGGEVAAFIAKMRLAGDDATIRFPLYNDEQGDPLPDAVWDALDDDDRYALEQLGGDFLPARFRQEVAT